MINCDRQNEMVIAKCKLIFKSSLLFKIAIACVFLFCVSTYFVCRSELFNERNEWDGNQDDYLVMGQFNYKLASKYITTWVDSWSKVVESQNIIVAVPDCESQDYPKLKSSNYLCYVHKWPQYDLRKGWFTPYINIAKVLKASEKRGILYVHDDMVINSSLRKKLGESTWFIALPSHAVIKIYKNGTTSTIKECEIIQNKQIVKVPKCRKMRDNFYWTGKMGIEEGMVRFPPKPNPGFVGCHKTFVNIMNDPDVSPYLQQSNTNGAYINVLYGQADLLYAFFNNSIQKEYFINILDLFAKHRLFLECAIPTAALMMQERFGVNIYYPKLCTRWDKYRNDIKRLVQYCEEKNHDHEAYHPIKLSKASNWSFYFEKIYHM